MSFFHFRRGKSVPRTAAIRARLRVESVEDRIAPAVFDIANGDIAALRAAITTSNDNNEPDIINLAANGKYTFLDSASAGNALPVITPDTGDSTNTLTINGNNSTFDRSSAVVMRFLAADSSTTPPVLFLNDITMQNGQSTVSGGAIFLGGTNATLTNVHLTNNQAKNGGGLVSVSTSNVSLTLVNCEIDTNSVNGGTNGIGGGIAVQGTVTLQFDKINVHDNQSQADGSGIWIQGADLNITNSIIRGNTGITTNPGGGGIWISGNLTMDNTQVANNTTVTSGGGIYAKGDATITNSSLTGNVTSSPLSGGGGLFITGNFDISNTTIDGNTAGAGGGAIAMAAGSVSGTLTHSTVTRNKINGDTPGQGGGIFINSAATLTLGDSIVAQNTNDSTVATAGGIDIFGAVASLGYNIIGATDGANITGVTTGNKTGTGAIPLDPLLGPLGNFGGNTLTRSLLPGSPAFDAGNPAFLVPSSGPLQFDQRGVGFPRKIGSRIDIGALEAAQVDLSIVKQDITLANSAVPGSTVTYQIIVTNNGPLDASGVVIDDVLSSSFSNIQWTIDQNLSSKFSGNLSGSGGIHETVSIQVNGQIVYILTAFVDPSATGKLANTATVTPPGGYADPNPLDNTSTYSYILTPQADAFVTLTQTGSAVPGNNVSYTITVGNTGPSTITGMFLQDIFPFVYNGAVWSSTATAGVSGNSAAGAGDINQVLSLTPGSGVTYTVTGTINPDTDPGILSNTVVITPPGSIDENTSNNSATVTDTLLVGRSLMATGTDTRSTPLVRVYNPISGTLRRSFLAYSSSFTGGVRVAVADMNGDQIPDIITAPGPGGGPHIKVFDGSSGVVLMQFMAYDPGFGGGVYIAAADVNGDGRADIITGAGAGGGPHVKVFDGTNGKLLQEFFAYAPSFGGGVRVAAADFNNDQKADIVTAAGPSGGPHVQVFSGADHSVLQSFFAYDTRFSGGVFVTTGDFNGDGVPDIVTGAGDGGGPHVRMFDGQNGFVFREFFAYPVASGVIGGNSRWNSGVRVAAATLPTNAGDQTFLFTAPGAGQNGLVHELNSGGGLVRNTQPYDPTFLGGVFVGAA